MQLTLRTQPRHIDSISRRIKLLNSEFERTSASGSGQAHHGNSAQQPRRTGARRDASSPATATAPSPNGASSASSTALPEQLAPVLTRLAPLLPHIPRVLARLRTLSALHTSAAGFERPLEGRGGK